MRLNPETGATYQKDLALHHRFFRKRHRVKIYYSYNLASSFRWKLAAGGENARNDG